MSQPQLYNELASWWPLLSPPADYAVEADFFRQTLLEACAIPPRTLLELGSGGGNTASHLKAHFQITLVDRAPAMLAVSRALNPECEHVEGDMRSVRLGRCFDCVLIHDAVSYLTSADDLRQTLETCFNHCRTGGAVLLAPDWIRESFQSGTDHGGSDEGNCGLRYLEWIWDPEPSDTTYYVDYAFLLREADGSVRAEHERHVCGLFWRADWLRLLAAVGFEPRAVPTADGREVFVGRKPAVRG